MTYFKLASLGMGIYILGNLLYKAKDVVECDPAPLGLVGVSKIVFALLIIWIMGYLSGREDK